MSNIGDLNAIWILTAVLGTVLSGLAVLFLGHRIRPYLGWLVASVLTALIVVIAISWSDSGFAFQPVFMARGWILPPGDTGALTVGAFEDPLGYSLSILAALLCMVLAMTRPLLAEEARPERTLASACLGSAAVCISWVSLTAWFSLVGLVIALLAGFLAFGSRWNSDDEALSSSRFGREAAFGLIFAMIGAFLLIASGADLAWKDSAPWPSTATTWLGSSFLITGLLIQLHPFPLLGWVSQPSQGVAPARALFTQIFPAWCALAALVRLEPRLRALGAFPVFGSIALVSVVLSALAGLVQTEWRRAHSLWLSSGFGLAAAALAFAGPWPGVSIALATGVAGYALSLLGTAMESESSEARARPGASRTALLLAAAASTGMVGFVSCGGTLRWLVLALGEPALAAAAGLALFLSALLAWRAAFILFRARSRSPLSPVVLAAAFATLVLSLAAVWTGTATGGAVPGNPDAFGRAALSALFSGAPALDESSFINASGLHWGLLFLAVATAYWTTARRKDSWEALRASFPRATAFVANGYGIDLVFDWILRGLRKAGDALESTIDRKTWNDWIPRGLHVAISRFAGFTARADLLMTDRLNGTVRRGVDVSGKMLQLIQSGDVQWYLFFAVGSGIAILIHFLKF
jgi:hypothetical protein